MKIAVHITFYIDDLKNKKKLNNFNVIINSFLKLAKNTFIFIHTNNFRFKTNIKNVKVLFNPNINRSLEYYTAMTFNITTNKKGKERVLVSGGRFDKLIGNLSNKNIPAVGAALNSDII